jgi:DNA-binding MarR family transcriptional regulator
VGAKSINNSASLFVLSGRMPRLSKNQKKILEILEVKPEMTTKEIAETVYGKLVEYRSKEYSSIHRSLMSLEKEGLIQRVFVQLKWRRKIQTV